jgi:putative ABC transport system permease protein
VKELLKVISSGLRSLFQKQRLERELEEELRSYSETATEEKMRAGKRTAEAARETRLEMGSFERLRQEVREVGWECTLEGLLQDVRFGARLLRKNPGFTAAAVLALALGIGANTAMFSVIEAVLLRPLPYKQAQRIARVASVWEVRGTLTPYTSSPPDFFDWREQNRSFTSMFAYYRGESALTGRGEARRVRVLSATAGMFSTLEAHPVVGREFYAEENHQGANHVAVLGYGFWQAEFAGSPEAVGQTVQLDSEPYTIVGVMPRDFRFPLAGSDVYVPVGFASDVSTQRGAHYLAVLGRLKDGVTAEEASRDLQAIMAELRRLYPDKDGKWGVRVEPWRNAIVADIRTALLVLLTAVALVALIACANISNLLLARATARSRELSMRRALGAGRLRLVRQMLTEGLLLAVAGWAAGLLMAHWALQAIVSFGPQDIPRLASVELNGAVLSFTVGISVGSALLFGLLPALRSSGLDAHGLVRPSVSSPREAQRLRAWLLVGEMALSTMLLAGAGLLMRSFVGLRSVDPGFTPAGVLTLTLSVPDAHYKTSQSLEVYWNEALLKVGGLPGVSSVGAIMPLPLSGDDFSSSFRVEGRDVPDKDEPSAQIRAATPGYFRTMQIPLRQGRSFTDADRLGSVRVLLASENAARTFFPEGALGQRIQFGARGGYEKNQGVIVGVVGDVRHNGVDLPAPPIFYVPLAQSGLDSATLVIRGQALSSLGSPARKLLDEIDRDALVGEAVPLEDLLEGSLGQRRFYTMLLAAFAALAMTLAAVGLYGVISYSAAQRTQEIGIRVALGATRGEVLGMVMGQGMRVSSAGLAVGLLLALLLSRAIRGLLVGVSTSDPATLGITAAVLLLVAALACFIPARRATRVDPVIALRFD